jgi:hypothetical protein
LIKDRNVTVISRLALQFATLDALAPAAGQAHPGDQRTAHRGQDRPGRP